MSCCVVTAYQANIERMIMDSFKKKAKYYNLPENMYSGYPTLRTVTLCIFPHLSYPDISMSIHTAFFSLLGRFRSNISHFLTALVNWILGNWSRNSYV